MTSALLACLLLAAAPAAGAANPRIAFERFTLPNGLRVILSTDPSIPVVAVAMAFDVGGRRETPGRSGFAHLFEHLMFEGSKNVPKGGFDRILESHGGDNNADTSEDYTFYYELVPSNAWPVALWLDADRVGGLDVSAHAVATQIEVVKEERRMRVDNEPYGPLLHVELASRTFSNWQNAHPVIGSFEDLDAAKLEDVRAFFDAYYAPANGILAIVGDFDPIEARRRVSELFGVLPARKTPPPVDAAEPPARGRVERLSDPHAKLPALAMAWKVSAPRAAPERFALTILGRALFLGKSARLYQGLVKEARSAVSVDGGLGYPVVEPHEFKAPGLFGAFIVHKAEHPAAEVRRRVEAELARISKDGLPEDELARVKTGFRSEWVSDMQTRRARARLLLLGALLDGDPEAGSRLEPYLAVTSEDVRRAAALLRPEDAVVIEVRPGGAR